MRSEQERDNSFESILAGLSEPLPESVIRQRVGWRDARGEEHRVDYIEWYTAADILDRVCPDWSHEVRDITVIGDLVAVTAAITIKGVTRCGVGVGSALEEKGIKGAEHDALKRAAIKFGLGRALYQGHARRKGATEPDAVQKISRSEDGVSDKQLAAIYAIAKAKSLDAHLESMA
ncbi:MAG TPA: Rad52/Rad22 family DNA repair protein, partial [Blastocatellia bacterium]|nr:Rad52/Rad22 family DNA repair protein [Blastocatellia bacterium]